ncbi:MAG: glycosyltransferase family 2 protein [Prevotella sp.]|nr:glycosyltransferase family 2 protein [Prevotella sp.]
MNSNPLLTVFTPTYNRAHLLPLLYESLCKQTFKNFEWVVVDDGSKDHTKEVLASFAQDEQAFFPIRCFYQENGGKHRAINHGVREAKGELFFISDSDDKLPPDALENVAKVYEDIKEDNSFAGICGLDGTFEGKVIGSGLPQEVIDDTSVAIRFKHRVTGDMKEVFRLSVLKEFPFPEIANEQFCPETLLWNRIATRYKLRYFNKIIYLAEYQEDGISAEIVTVRMKSPVASMMTYAELNQIPMMPFLQKCKAAVNYWRFRFCANKDVVPPKISPWWGWVIPMAWLMHQKDKTK